MAGRDEWLSLDALEDLDTMVDIVQGVVLNNRSEGLDQDTRWRLEDALERARAREEGQGRPFSRREVNAGLRNGEHRSLTHQQY